MSRYNFKYVAFLVWGGFQVIVGIIFIMSWGLAQGLVLLLLGIWSIVSTIAEMRGLSYLQVQLWYLIKGITFLVVGLLLLAGGTVSNAVLTTGGFLGLLYGGWCTFSSISQLRVMGEQ